jgi:Acyl-CoA synthetases (AMP-forming)/AMP-acid ligases II
MALVDLVGHLTIDQLVPDVCRQRGEQVYATFRDETLTFAELSEESERLAANLRSRDDHGELKVALMLGNTRTHVIAYFAVLRAGAVLVELNPALAARSLIDSVRIADAQILISSNDNRLVADEILSATGITAIWVDDSSVPVGADLHSVPPFLPPNEPRDESRHAALFFTSGTTGAPKAAILTDRSLRACTAAVAIATDAREGDVYYVWEPLFHVGGSQMLLLPFLHEVRLAIVEKFSVRRFWDDIDRFDVTHFHYLGGILQLLIKNAPRPATGAPRVRVAWGAGAPAGLRSAVASAYGVEIREVYGMTETGSINLVNVGGATGSMGSPIEPYRAGVIRPGSSPPEFLGAGVVGELVIHDSGERLVTSGYLGQPTASAELLRDGWLRTGDLAYQDEHGEFYFAGRLKDSLRHRGENVSAWEVESVTNLHPDVEESALVGVPNDFGDDDLLLVVKLRDGAPHDPADLHRWCSLRLAKFQVPRYIRFVQHFEKTPSERIVKAAIDRDIRSDWDAH